MAFRLPTIPDFKAQFVRDFPYATPLSIPNVVGAEASASINNGQSVSGIAVTSAGSGLPSSVAAIIYGGGGVGARASVTVTSGAVTAVTVVNAGYGYQQAPNVYLTQGGDNTDQEKVTDFDIASAFGLAAVNQSLGLFGSQAALTRVINLLAAHYLCENLTAGGTGLGGKGEWLTASKSGGNVAEAYHIPPRILKSPYLAKLSKTTYGAQYLELLSPQLIGNFRSYHRDTLP